MTVAEDLFSEALALLAPPPKQTLSEWAREHFYLSTGAERGYFKPKAFQVEPLDCISDPRVHTTVIMSATQMLKTTIILVALAYVIAKDPDPAMVVQPRDSDVNKFSKFRLAPMLRDIPDLKGKVSESRSRNSQSTIDVKDFPGGPLILTAAGSPGNLAAFPVRYLFCDEIDKFPASAGSEGDPISLGKKRTATYRNRRKIILTCSPTIAGYSRIEKAYLESDQRQFFVPCPECNVEQVLKWQKVIWDSTAPKEHQPASAYYECGNCGVHWNDVERWNAVKRGHWQAAEPFRGIAGFQISELYSPWKTLADIVSDFLEKKDDPQQLKTFLNTSLAEVWQEQGEAPDWERLVNRREQYRQVPKGGLFLTAGADVQRDRIEVEVVAWGRNRESWSVEYEILEGRVSEPEVWKKLDQLLTRVYPSEAGGELPISRLFIDSGDGTTTNDVYAWARKQPVDRVTAIKGDDRGVLPVGQPSPVDVKIDGKKDPTGIKIKSVKVSFFKSELYAALRLRTPTEEERAAGLGFPPGYCHFPDQKNYGDEHFKQLCAEQLVSHTDKRGRTRREWQQIRPRNEALDARIYARAAAWDFGLDTAQEQHWQALETRLKTEEKPAAAQPTAQRRDQREPFIPRRNWFRDDG